jgi:hypothetical protein
MRTCRKRLGFAKRWLIPMSQAVRLFSLISVGTSEEYAPLHSMRGREPPRSTRSASFQSFPLRATAIGGTMSTIDNSAACTPGAANARRRWLSSRAPNRIFVERSFHSAIPIRRSAPTLLSLQTKHGSSRAGALCDLARIAKRRRGISLQVCVLHSTLQDERNSLQLAENNHSRHSTLISGVCNTANLPPAQLWLLRSYPAAPPGNRGFPLRVATDLGSLWGGVSTPP